MDIFVKRISSDYFRYNPSGDILYNIARDDCSKMLYIQEVGLFNNEDKILGNSELDIYFGSDWFTVYKYKKGLFKTPLAAKRKILKMIKNYKEEEGYYI